MAPDRNSPRRRTPAACAGYVAALDVRGAVLAQARGALAEVEDPAHDKTDADDDLMRSLRPTVARTRQR